MTQKKFMILLSEVFLPKKKRNKPQNCMSLGLFYKITSRLVISPDVKLRNFDVADNLIKTD